MSLIRIQQASYEQVNEPSPDSVYAGMLILDSKLQNSEKQAAVVWKPPTVFHYSCPDGLGRS